MGSMARLDSARSLGGEEDRQPSERPLRAHTAHSGAAAEGRVASHGSEAGAEGKSCSVPVRVVARVRPLLPFETVHSSRTCVTVHGGQTLVMGKDRMFNFDSVYGPAAPQDAIYAEWVSPLVDGLFSGYNATVLAYGQTGAGKTFTMGSGDNAGKTPAELGVIPRVMRDIYERLEQLTLERTAGGGCAHEVRVRVSYIEIYNEEVRDLLEPGISKTLAIREKADGSIVVAGAKQVLASTLSEMQSMLDVGSVSRTVAGTLMNNQSSRSHSIFTITVHQRLPSSRAGVPFELVSAKFHLVDLAGSERAKRTGNEGLRLKESVSINAGLLALGNVISALVAISKNKAAGHHSHIPYRQSKLTRMLQDSLGGNSRTVMVACISPSDGSFEETLNTLKYAQRARNITNVAIVNRVEDDVPSAAAVPEVLHVEDEDEGDEQPEQVSAREAALQERVDELQAANAKLQEHAERVDRKAQKMGEANLKILAERDEAQAARDDALSMLHEITGHLQRMSDTRSMRQSLRCSLQNVEQQLRDYQAENQGPPTAAGRPNSKATPEGTARPLTAPPPRRDAGAEGRGESAEVQKLKAMAREAQQELASKTAELRELEALLEDPSASALAKSLSSISDLLHQKHDQKGVGGGVSGHPRTQDDKQSDTRGVIERNLRKIQALETELAAANETRAMQEELVAELRQDLARDEEIFASKTKETRDLQVKLRDTESALAAARVECEQAAAEMQNLRIQMALQSRSLAAPQAAEPAMPARPAPTQAAVAGGDGVDGLTITMKQQAANCALAAMVEDDDGVQMGDELEDSLCPPSSGGHTGVADALRGHAASAAPGTGSVGGAGAFMNEEKRRLIEEKKELELAQDKMTREFHLQQHYAEKRLRELSFTMQLKQELIRELVKTEQSLQAAKEADDERILALEAEIEALHKEQRRDSSATADTSTASRGASRGHSRGGEGREGRDDDRDKNEKVEDHRRARDQLAAKLKEREAQLEALRHQQHENRKLAKDKEASDKRIRLLEAEVGKMQQQAETLKVRQRDDDARFAEEKAAHASKIKQLKAVTDEKIASLEAANAKQREELVGARQALRSTVGSRGGRESEQQARLKKWLESEMDKFLERKAAMEELEDQVRKREQVVREKEELLQDQAKFDLKRRRNVEEMRQSIHGLQTKIDSIAKEEAGGGAGAAGSLEHQKVAAIRERDELERRLASKEETLSEEDRQQLVEVEERLEALDLEMEYKAENIAQLQSLVQQQDARAKEGSQAGGLRGLDALLAAADGRAGAGAAGSSWSLDEDEAKDLLQECLKRVLLLEEVARKRDKEREALEAEAAARKEEATQLQKALERVHLEAQRETAERERRHQRDIQVLLRREGLNNSLDRGVAAREVGAVALQATVAHQTPHAEGGGEQTVLEHKDSSQDEHAEAQRRLEMLQEQVGMLDKDNFYYKQSNSNLKRRLRELSAAGEQVSRPPPGAVAPPLGPPPPPTGPHTHTRSILSLTSQNDERSPGTESPGMRLQCRAPHADTKSCISLPGACTDGTAGSRA
jgi:hypothetical protein